MSSSDPKTRPKPGPWPPAPDATPVPPSSWAKRTGFRPKFSGETNASDSGQISLPPKPREPVNQPDLEAGRARATPPPAPVPAPASSQALANGDGEKVPALVAPTNKDQTVKRRRDSDKGLSMNGNGHGNGNGSGPAGPTETNQHPQPQPRRAPRNEEMVVVDGMDDDGFTSRHSHMKYQLRDTPGLVPIGLYGIQHYLSMLGSLILIPLVIVPAMGGSHEDTSNVVSTVLFVSGVTTLLHTFFGSRLPLVQGSSFVFLAPALAIINSPEFQGLNGNNFKHIMKELQGAIIIGSVFQAFLGYSGLMSLLLRLINPVVVAPTIAAVGLSFYSYGFPLVGTCLEIGVVQILLVILFSLVGSYHASSLLVASRPPTPGVVSRAIGLEGLCSVLAGLWGTGTGSTTLTENVHTIAVTKMGSRRAVEIGAGILIVLSLIGKVGGLIASIPQVMVAALLCFMWAMLAALGLSNLRYSEAGSSRNIIIVGLSLFFSLSIPAYFQQYGISPNTNLSVPSYFQPYSVASHGPFRSKYGGVNYVMNTLLSLHVVVAFLFAVVLDNTVPGSRQERGVYEWSETEAARREPAIAKDYELPFRVGRVFRWVKWVGL
ncbi:nucleobase-ascorbate transporter 12 isoform X3 [Citrus clementina]|uniref:nucleobase-ascorbate transporter 12 isoform X3 n=1 Tax=Citrus clementina TaxID=85681 RepID=UPI000CED587C|nr:nucleobase-ascorbate transporter 12 isoform X3 [Citrus x clementina]